MNRRNRRAGIAQQAAEKSLDRPRFPLIRSDFRSTSGIEDSLRGEDTSNHTLFSYLRTDNRIPSNHPLRLIRRIADAALTALSDHFDAVYATEGRPSIPPERLLRALLIQAFYSVRSERQLMEQLNYNLLFRGFVGLSVDDPVWDPSTFSKNHERVLNEDFAACFLDAVSNADKVKGLVSSEHFSVDGTLIQAWASMKSFRRKDGQDQPPSGGRNGERDFHKEKPADETHASTTDPDARLYRKGRVRKQNFALSDTSPWRTETD
jgi:transposase